MAKKKIRVCGSIVSSDDAWIYDWFEMEYCCPKNIATQLASIGDEPFEVEINSPGGDVFAGSEIYTLLSQHKKNMTINVVGIAASAASVIAMAGKCYMSPTAMLMVHNVSACTGGDYRDMDHMSEVLKNANQAIASSYCNKSGMSIEEALKMMDKETWLTAQQAKEKGLIDGVMFENEGDFKLAASISNGLLPREVIEKMKAEKLEKITAEKKQGLKNKLDSLRRMNNEF